jgi:GxxExxY protein
VRVSNPDLASKCARRNFNNASFLKLANMNENDISHKIIGAAMEIHKTLGPGLLESAYEAALAYDLKELGFDVKTQLPMPLVYKEVKQDVGYRIDLLVDNKVIIELKAVESLAPVHFAQTLTYLKLSEKKLALLINFNTKLLKDGIHRIVNKL